MPVHAICPSLQCQKILELPDDARGREVNCRYCGMRFRVPRIRRRPIEINPQSIEAQPEPADSRGGGVIYVGG